MHRTLKYLDQDDDEQQQELRSEKDEKDDEDIINYISKHLKIGAASNGNDCCVPEFQNFRRGLTSSTDTSYANVDLNAHSNRRLLRAIPRQITSILKGELEIKAS